MRTVRRSPSFAIKSGRSTRTRRRRDHCRRTRCRADANSRAGSPRKPAPPTRRRRRVTAGRAWWLAVAFIVVIPLGAFLLYQRLGNPGATVAANASTGHDVTEPQIVAMVDALAQRLKQHPEDADGWMLLGRSYQALDRFPESADAYAHASALVKDDPNLLADYADVLAMTQNRKLAGKPAELIERALAIDPTHKKALALAATAALEAHDFALSLEYWRRLAARCPPDPMKRRQSSGRHRGDHLRAARRQDRHAADRWVTRPASQPGRNSPDTAGCQQDGGRDDQRSRRYRAGIRVEGCAQRHRVHLRARRRRLAHATGGAAHSRAGTCRRISRSTTAWAWRPAPSCPRRRGHRRGAHFEEWQRHCRSRAICSAGARRSSRARAGCGSPSTRLSRSPPGEFHSF